MTSAEASAAPGRYRRAHPGAWDRLRQVIDKGSRQASGRWPDCFVVTLDIALSCRGQLRHEVARCE